MSQKYIVITSIFPPTEAIEKFSQIANWKIIVVADKKTKPDWSFPNVEFISVSDQEAMKSSFVSGLPWNSYTRKNIGYALAISRGAEVIYDTDDDNIPLGNWIREPEFEGQHEVLSEAKFINVYSLFTDKLVWPRGYPLSLILNPPAYQSTQKTTKIGIWQYLADEDPDVDAIYRLTNNTPIYFMQRSPVVLAEGTVCPFNSQNTYFRKEVFPLLYLPSTVTFRFTDILRGLVAQPILWAAGYQLGFGGATVIQKRNPHNYLKDFESEVPVYLFAEKVTEIAQQHSLPTRSITENLMAVYQALEQEKIVTENEIALLKLWMQNLRHGSLDLLSDGPIDVKS